MFLDELYQNLAIDLTDGRNACTFILCAASLTKIVLNLRSYYAFANKLASSSVKMLALHLFLAPPHIFKNGEEQIQLITTAMDYWESACRKDK
ncbi:hypothetical protein UH38_09170 [Aliterella atlantica CENA595]|uniref:Uncharacterized protein n=1 Tax=Aliterella atlantica CENA595 TaxID=1618023 RepID=A0A0D8ZT28_9CYAN|nr:hypothetical protein UH38_09170 [Aliterella atlantica CENA595]